MFKTYDPIDFDEYLIEPTAHLPVESIGDLKWSYKIKPDANPPPEKFHVLMANVEKFDALWNHQRDFPSESEYDLALAPIALSVQWTDQETVDLLIAHRRKYGADLKLDRGEKHCYYRLTLNKAAQGQVAEESESILQQFKTTGEVPEEIRNDPASVKEFLSRSLGVRIGKFIKWMCEPHEYALEINGEIVQIGKVEGLWSQGNFHKIIWDATGEVLTWYESKKWKRIRNLIMEMRMEETVSPEASGKEAIQLWLDQWIADFTDPEDDDWERTLKGNSPYVKDGEIYFPLVGFQNYLEVFTKERWRHKDISVRLRLLGLESTRVNIDANNSARGRTTRNVWKYGPFNQTR